MSQLEGKEAIVVADSPPHAERLKKDRHRCNECLTIFSSSHSAITDIGILHTAKPGGLYTVRAKAPQSQCVTHQQKVPSAADQKFKAQGNVSVEKADAQNAGKTSHILSPTCHPDFQYEAPDPQVHGTIVVRGGFWEPPAKPRPPEWDDDEETRKLKVWREFQKALNEIRVEAAEKQRKMDEQEEATRARRLRPN
jgi:hypothetical protein